MNRASKRAGTFARRREIRVILPIFRLKALPGSQTPNRGPPTERKAAAFAGVSDCVISSKMTRMDLRTAMTFEDNETERTKVFSQGESIVL